MAPIFGDNGLSAYVRKLADGFNQIKSAVIQLKGQVDALQAQGMKAKSTWDIINEIPGRRVPYNYVGSLEFAEAQEGTRGQPINIPVSQDGPFIQTAYPLVLWYPTAPESATNYLDIRPVYSWPLPDQVVDADYISMLYEVNDGGSDRQFQNAPAPPLFSRPDLVQPLPEPMIWTPNSVLQFVPTFLGIHFNGSTPPTAGLLLVAFPGFKIANL